MTGSDSAPQKTVWDDSNESQTALSVIVNGKQVRTVVADRLLLSDFLRDHLGLTALKVACGEGACGACTIVIDGEPARSCTLLAVQTEGAEILTLEGLNSPQGLNHVQQLFQQHHALQCGYCTPGWLMTVYSIRSAGSRLHTPERSNRRDWQQFQFSGAKSVVFYRAAALSMQRCQRS